MRRFLKFISYLLLAIVLFSLLIVQFFGGKISQAVVGGLNQSLNTEIAIRDIQVSLLRSFPYLTVDLQGVKMAGSDGSSLLEAEQIKTRIGLSSLFGKTRIKSITISNGALHIVVDQDGNNNYHLFEYVPVDVRLAQQNEPSEAVSFAIEDARLENIDLTYQNFQLQTEASILVLDANFQGDFGQEIYDMFTTVNAEIRFLDLDKLRLLAGESLRIGAESQVNNTQKLYNYKELYLGLGGLNLRASGSMQEVEDGWLHDLRFESEKSSLADLLRLLPQQYANQLEGLRSQGNFSLTGQISDKWTQTQQPQMDFRLSFSDGQLGGKGATKAQDINFSGEFTNGDQRLASSSAFRIENLSGRFGQEAFDIRFAIENFQAPTISLAANGNIPLDALLTYLPSANIQNSQGSLRLQDIQLEGRYADMLSARGMGRVKSSGRLTLDNVSLEINDRPLSLPSGQLLIKNNAVEINALRLLAQGNDLSFTGRANNFIPVLFADSLNTYDAQLAFNALLNAQEIDIEQLLALAGPSEADLATAEKSGTTDSLARKSVARRAQITDLLSGQFNANFQQWQYGQMQGKDFRGLLEFSPQKMHIKGQTAAMEGQWQVEGDLFFVESPRLEARVVASQVNIAEFFRQADNFGQTVLTHRHLSGKLDSKIYIRAYFSEAGELDYDRLLVLAGLGVKEGEVRDFEMLENFSAILKTKDLERVRFSKLENYLEVSRSTVYIPVLFIQSSAVNLTMNGSHTFSQQMDYNIKVNAGQVLANKIARHDEQLEVLPARNKGFFNLYYSLQGPLENYQVETNKRKVKSAFEQSEAHKNRIRRELESQFQESLEYINEPIDWRDLTDSSELPGR